MELAVEGWIRNRVGDEKALRMIKDAGFDAVDYSFYWPREGDNVLAGDYVQRAHALRQYLDAIGLACHQAHAPFEMKYGEPWDESSQHYADIVRSMEFAAILGADHIVVHSLRPDDGVDLLDCNTRYYQSFEPYCQKYQIKIAIENLFISDKKCRCFRDRIGRADSMKEILRRLSSPWYVLCVDVGHAAISGTEPEELIAALDAQCLRGLHIQDTNYLGDCHMAPYMGGLLDWDKITSALAHIQYRGDFTFEVFAYLKKMPETLLPDALSLVAKIGRYMISLIEQASA